MFWKKKQDDTKIEGIEYPKIGDRWIEKSENGSPWGNVSAGFVEILDQRENWVLFGRRYAGRYPTSSVREYFHSLPVNVFFYRYQPFIPLPEPK
jgi:hypothetical protein